MIWLNFLAAMPLLLAPQPDRGKQIVNDALAALGGPRYLAMQDRVETGRAYSFYREQLSGLSVATIYTRYLTASGKSSGSLAVREREAFGKNEDSAILFNELGGWEVTFRGARPLPDDLLARYRDTTLHSIFYILRQRMNEPGMVFESRGVDIVQNQPVRIVDITDSDNRTVTVYFHQDTRLPVRQVYWRRDPKTRERNEEVTYFSKYRDVGGGVMWPLAIERERNGEKIFQMFSDSVAINKELRDDLFTLPANIKILKKER